MTCGNYCGIKVLEGIPLLILKKHQIDLIIFWMIEGILQSFKDTLYLELYANSQSEFKEQTFTMKLDITLSFKSYNYL